MENKEFEEFEEFKKRVICILNKTLEILELKKKDVYSFIEEIKNSKDIVELTELSLKHIKSSITINKKE